MRFATNSPGEVELQQREGNEGEVDGVGVGEGPSNPSHSQTLTHEYSRDIPDLSPSAPATVDSPGDQEGARRGRAAFFAELPAASKSESRRIISGRDLLPGPTEPGVPPQTIQAGAVLPVECDHVAVDGATAG